MIKLLHAAVTVNPNPNPNSKATSNPIPNLLYE